MFGCAGAMLMVLTAIRMTMLIAVLVLLIAEVAREGARRYSMLGNFQG